MEILSREEVVERLVRDEIDSIEQMILQNDYSYIDSIVRDGGIVGISNLCNDDLIEEYRNKFDEFIEIL